LLVLVSCEVIEAFNIENGDFLIQFLKYIGLTIYVKNIYYTLHRLKTVSYNLLEQFNF